MNDLGARISAADFHSVPGSCPTDATAGRGSNLDRCFGPRLREKANYSSRRQITHDAPLRHHLRLEEQRA